MCSLEVKFYVLIERRFDEKAVVKVRFSFVRRKLYFIVYHFQAKEIYAQSGGKQQVLPLDSIYKKNLPDWNKYVLNWYVPVK